MRHGGERDRYSRLVERAAPGATLCDVAALPGGVSSRVTVVGVRYPDGRHHRLVVREYGDRDLQRNPDVAAHEFRVLQVVRAAGVPAPEPHYLDRTGAILGTPLIVIAYVDGQNGLTSSDLDRGLPQLAETLAKIHSVDLAAADLSFLPRQEVVYAEVLTLRPATLDDSLDEPRIREVLEPIWPLPRRNRPVLLHGDYWPGNTLWRDGRLVAVVDWEDAALGDPLADLGNARLEILWAYGPDAMHAFTRRYRELMPHIDVSHLPYWDLVAALRPAGKLSEWGLDPQTEQTMRTRHRLFVDQALQALNRR
ncbi:phosphotransferase family protein [Sphaerobacter sp.]|uniref:phosphotransferase family protein n=1 Tax=Sphaerobacter sp. TaxID=2099654 RepID=UPI0025F2A305|nr:phosphotransferase family protein [Sphaerobacter sp.]